VDSGCLYEERKGSKRRKEEKRRIAEIREKGRSKTTVLNNLFE
jgi:hypothetical protein